MQDDSKDEPSPIFDTSSSLAYGKGMEFQYLNPTQPLRLPLSLREKRLRELRQEREERNRSDSTPAPVMAVANASTIATVATGASEVPPPLSIAQPTVAKPKKIGGMSIGQATLVITLSMAGSRIIGMAQSIFFGYIFKPSDYANAFTVASLIPNLIYNVVAGGALASAFIPVFKEYMQLKQEEREGWRIASTALNLVLVALVLFALLAAIVAEPLLRLYLPNASETEITLSAALTRIMLLQAVVMGCGVIINAILSSYQEFLLPSIGSFLYPIGSILGLIPALFVIHKNVELAIYFATAGVVLSAVLMVGAQIPGVIRLRMHYSFSLDWRHPAMLRIFRQMGPRLANTVMINLSSFVDTFLLSLLSGQGLIYLYNRSLSAVTIPLSLALAVATAAFPAMAGHAIAGRLDRLSDVVSDALHSILFVSIPSSIAMIIISLPLVQILYEHGSTQYASAQQLAIALFGFSLGLPGLAAVEILTRAFYAMGNSKTPVLISLWQFTLKIGVAILLLNPAIWLVDHGLRSFFPVVLSVTELEGSWGMSALALSTSIAALLEAFVLLWVLQQQIGGLQLRALWSFVVRVLAATAIMSIALAASLWLLDKVLVTAGTDGTETLGLVGSFLLLVKLSIVVGIGSVVYLRAARLLHLRKLKEVRQVDRLLTRLHMSWL